MALAEKLGVQFTFFISVGQSVSRPDFIKRALFSGLEDSPLAPSLSARQKLGLYEYIKLSLFNSRIGAAHPSIVRDLSRSQEVGLHGGQNHDTWLHGASHWDRRRLEFELDWALNQLAKMDVQVDGFSCPGWRESPHLIEALKARGFKYRADRHGLQETGVVQEAGPFLNVSTNILGEPGGVAYIEHLRAQSKTDREVLFDFKSRLQAVGDYAVVYDHPYFAGVHELGLVEDCVKLAKDEGYTVLPLREIARARQ